MTLAVVRWGRAAQTCFICGKRAVDERYAMTHREYLCRDSRACLVRVRDLIVKTGSLPVTPPEYRPTYGISVTT